MVHVHEHAPGLGPEPISQGVVGGLGRRLDVPALLTDLALDGVQRDRLEHHRRRLACFWLAMLLPGSRGWHRNPAGSTEDEVRHLLELMHTR